MIFSRNSVRGVMVAALVFMGSAASAQIDATNPDAIMKAMQKYGFVATLEKDNQGDPKIVSRVSRTKFRVYFFGCKENLNCASIHFRAGYDLKNPISALVVNEWNRNKRFTKAYIDDEGDPFLEMDVNMAFDGTGEQNFQDTLDWWRVMVENFEEFIDW